MVAPVCHQDKDASAPDVDGEPLAAERRRCLVARLPDIWALTETCQIQPLAADVLEHAVGYQRAQVRLAGSQVHVQETVVVEITVVAAHGGEHQIQTCWLGHVFETRSIHVPKQPV